MEHEKDDKIKQLEAELERTKTYVQHSEEAANILKELVQRGEVSQNPDGTVSV